MVDFPEKEGEVDYDAPGAGKPCKTWFKIIGDLETNTPPLIGLHGGPGAGHEYLLPLTDVLQAQRIPIILYDQVGCGRSTHLQEKMGDEDFWSFDLFIRELDNLVDHLGLREKGFHLLGHSWGGVLGAAYAARQPRGLRKLVVASGPASIPLYVKGLKTLLAALPADVRKTLEECEKKGDYESPEYEAAAAVFYGRHVCRLNPYPKEIEEGFKHLKEDPTAYMTIQGPSEFTVVGSIKHYEGYKEAHNIKAETLMINGKYDEVTDISFEPWFWGIHRVKWVTLENASHMTHFEEREKFMQLVGKFLADSSP